LFFCFWKWLLNSVLRVVRGAGFEPATPCV
jgi:hypothetical protein